jgi:protocatechuate 3,4-dioxygenase beta subunit
MIWRRRHFGASKGNERMRPTDIERRAVLGWIGGAGLLSLVGCLEDPARTSTTSDALGEDAPPEGADDATGLGEDSEGVFADSGPSDVTPDTVSDSTPADVADDISPDTPPDAATLVWATGGTAAMTAKATYPNPHGELLSGCELFAPTTAGPCTSALQPAREDLSEGFPGLPVRLSLRLVDPACTPLPGRALRIWHTTPAGSYTGETPNNRFCVLDDALAATHAFRGVQTTDQDGVVAFDTCFPGWYPGRAIHFHFQILDGDRTLGVSQLFFAEDLTASIFATHPDYVQYGQPDTTFSSDGVIRAIPVAERGRHLLEVARMPDGAMLASKTLVVT